MEEVRKGFELYFEKVGPDECWPWKGRLRNKKAPYGYFTIKGRKEGAHRLAFLLYKGPFVAGQIIMHTCDNPRCVNPAHLEQGTYGDNTKDMMGKSRGVKRTGELNTMAKFTQQQVYRIRELVASGEAKQIELANFYKVQRSCISKIINGLNWKGCKYE